jgi:hypothetical protein
MALPELQFRHRTRNSVALNEDDFWVPTRYTLDFNSQSAATIVEFGPTTSAVSLPYNHRRRTM